MVPTVTGRASWFQLQGFRQLKPSISSTIGATIVCSSRRFSGAPIRSSYPFPPHTHTPWIQLQTSSEQSPCGVLPPKQAGFSTLSGFSGWWPEYGTYCSRSPYCHKPQWSPRPPLRFYSENEQILFTHFIYAPASGRTVDQLRGGSTSSITGY